MGTKRPLVSIIIPCFNAERWVAQAIESCLNQTYSPIEIIVVDDGSNDKSLEIIESFSKGIHFQTGPNRGGCAARNKGLELSRGIYVKFLDADDLLIPSCLERQVRLSEDYPPNVLIFGQSGGIIDEKGKIISPAHHLPEIRESDDNLSYLLANVINTPCFLHRRAILNKIGGFRPGLRKGHEYELHLRLALSGIKFRSESGAVFLHRHHSSSDRVSVAMSLRNAPEANIELLSITEELLRKNFPGGIPSNIQILLGRAWWGLGRELIRCQKEKDACICFDKAADVKPYSIVGSSYYRTAVRVFGPIFAEKLFGIIKRIFKGVISLIPEKI